MNILETDGEKLLVAVRGLLAAKGIASRRDRRAHRDYRRGLAGRRVRGWWRGPGPIPNYRALMLEDGTRPPRRSASRCAARRRSACWRTPTTHNLVVCTLCSCYPRAVLGYPPFWYKSAAYRARGVRDPRGLIAEWGTVLPEGVKIQVVDSTADYRWMVLPRRPARTEGWTEQRFASIVREGDMIGVTIPTAA